MFIIDFLKSLFIPKYMQKNRYMSILIAICIFVCSTYLLLLPARWYYNHNTTKLVNNDNIYYLQSIRDISANTQGNDDITDLVNEISNKGIALVGNKVTSTHLGVYDVNISNDYLGVISKNNGNWYFNNVDTNIVISDTSKDLPLIKAFDGEIEIDNVNDKKIALPGIISGDEIQIVKLSLLQNNSHLTIDGIDTNILITSDKFEVTKVDGNIVVNGNKTNISVTDKAIIYFVPNTTTYYEKDFSYVADNGIKRNIKFVVDLSQGYISESPYTVDNYSCDYTNEDFYFLVVTTESLFYQANLKGINEKKIVRDEKELSCLGFNSNLAKSNFSLVDITVDDFGNYIYQTIINGYVNMAISNYSIISLFYLVIYTLIVAFLYSLLFRRNGKLKRFKEYYNIASLANFVPLIITFVFMWFNPGWFGTVYLCTFAIYYLFVLYRINNSSEIA